MEKEILLIESDANGTLAEALREAGYDCVCATSVQRALQAVEGGGFALAVVNCALGDVRAPELISLLRARGRFPILAIPVEGGPDELAELVCAGADDYVARPFELRELMLRVEVQLRRGAGARSRGTLRHKALVLDPSAFTVTLCGQSVALTKQEFRILELMLLSPPGRVFSKQDFFDYAWEHDYIGLDKTINVHICNMRKKFRAITEDKYIETIWGMGFRLV